ncbi:hypothetical protein Trydic_g23227 [Trypoxylus dichotomus]
MQPQTWILPTPCLRVASKHGSAKASPTRRRTYRRLFDPTFALPIIPQEFLERAKRCMRPCPHTPSPVCVIDTFTNKLMILQNFCLYTIAKCENNQIVLLRDKDCVKRGQYNLHRVHI